MVCPALLRPADATACTGASGDCFAAVAGLVMLASRATPAAMAIVAP
jgi:hypothetical protein